jgi:hypothetical protein
MGEWVGEAHAGDAKKTPIVDELQFKLITSMI